MVILHSKATPRSRRVTSYRTTDWLFMQPFRQLCLLWESSNRKGVWNLSLKWAKEISDTTLVLEGLQVSFNLLARVLIIGRIGLVFLLGAKVESVQSLHCYVWINTLGWVEIVWLIGVANGVGEILQKTKCCLCKWGLGIVLRQSFLLHFCMSHERSTHCPLFWTSFSRMFI